MFSIASIALFALAISSVTALVVPRGPDAPTDWSSSLEDYAGYHARYMAISCYTKHNDPAFFDRCCHPLQNGAQPNPSCPSPSAVDDSLDNDDDCEDDSSLAPTPTATATTAASPTSAPLNNSAAKEQDTGVDLEVDAHIVQGGVATFYYQQGNAGACGHYNGDDALIAAMDYRTYGNTSRKSPLCGKQVEITNTKNHKKVVVTIADACPTCKNKNSIDLSVRAFEKIATKDEGEVPISWRYL